ncbi:flhB C-terminus-related protein [Paenibacillaceae bacterium GAS479]|nr:flhB C-terminus-related protein [Paenibacillaceae bacterium GAS479]
MSQFDHRTESLGSGTSQGSATPKSSQTPNGSSATVDAPRKAVALKYNPTDGAPVVVAKGKGQLADEIIQRARENGVAVQEDRSLVEVLSKLDLDQQIPGELYELVAEVLSFIYRTDKQAAPLSDLSESRDRR